MLGWHSPTRLRIASTIHLTTVGSVRSSLNFNPHKDIVVPPYANYSVALAMYPDGDGAWMRGEGRSMRAYFRGTFIPDDRYSWGVRQYLKVLGTVYPETYHVKEGHGSEYWAEMGQAVFSLCPAGMCA